MVVEGLSPQQASSKRRRSKAATQQGHDSDGELEHNRATFYRHLKRFRGQQIQPDWAGRCLQTTEGCNSFLACWSFCWVHVQPRYTSMNMLSISPARMELSLAIRLGFWSSTWCRMSGTFYKGLSNGARASTPHANMFRFARIQITASGSKHIGCLSWLLKLRRGSSRFPMLRSCLTVRTYTYVFKPHICFSTNCKLQAVVD